MSRVLLVTGGAGFVGSSFVRDAVLRRGLRVVTLDALTYAGSRENLAALDGDARHAFVHGDVRDRPLVARLLREHRPAAVVHMAAESHVDRSIDDPGDFVTTNVVGTFELLEAVRGHLAGTPGDEARAFRVLHVSTDEVFGDRGDGAACDEATPYAPSSPYAASKAGADLLVAAYHRTYGLPVVTTHCSNNLGPFQLPEKLVPRTIANAIAGRPVPVYGDGRQVRDWLHVEDHCDGLHAVLERGRVGERYLLGGHNERRNIDVVEGVCRILDEENRAAGRPVRSCLELVTFVADRPGHDRRYAIDPSKAERELGWRARRPLEDTLRETVRWYLQNGDWWKPRAARLGDARRGLGEARVKAEDAPR
jgi:dTDP-glucose 4,6-dehydratase